MSYCISLNSMFFNGKNFELLIIDELNRKGFTTGTGNSRETKLAVQVLKNYYNHLKW